MKNTSFFCFIKLLFKSNLPQAQGSKNNFFLRFLLFDATLTSLICMSMQAQPAIDFYWKSSIVFSLQLKCIVMFFWKTFSTQFVCTFWRATVCFTWHWENWFVLVVRGIECDFNEVRGVHCTLFKNKFYILYIDSKIYFPQTRIVSIPACTSETYNKLAEKNSKTKCKFKNKLKIKFLRCFEAFSRTTLKISTTLWRFVIYLVVKDTAWKSNLKWTWHF